MLIIYIKTKMLISMLKQYAVRNKLEINKSSDNLINNLNNIYF